ncbi:DUF6603 domain-containing protein [Streptomyces sp. NPDC001985]|uniref:DUF6603 domain-containing protein n=1 Tax=Streptomyces sp. NPDC001985 TaxID=3154406 RepID=UPI00332B498B
MEESAARAMIPPGLTTTSTPGEIMALSLQELLSLFPGSDDDFGIPFERLRDLGGVPELLATWLQSSDLTVRGSVPDRGTLTVEGNLSFTLVDGACPVVVSFTADAAQTVTGVSLDFTLPSSDDAETAGAAGENGENGGSEEEDEEDEEDPGLAPHLVLTAGLQLSAALSLPFAGGEKEMVFTAGYEGGTLTGDWSSDEGLSWDDIAGALGTAPAELPPALVPSLHRVAFVYEKRRRAVVLSARTEYVQLAWASLPRRRSAIGTGRRLRAVLLQGVHEAGLADLPTIGEHIPLEDDLVLAGLQAFHLSAPMRARAVKAVNELMADAGVGLGLPSRDLTAGASVAITGGIALTARNYALVHPLRRRKPGTGPGPGPVPPPFAPVPAAPPVLPAVAGDDDTPEPAKASLPVDAVLGPLRIAEISLGYDEGTVRVTIDATLDAGGVELSASGLGFTVRVDAGDGDWEFTPVLSGLGLAYDRPPVRIAGAFLAKRSEPPYEQLFAGMAVIEAKVVSVKVLGAYARAEGGFPSLFLYGVLGGRSGLGPPPFQVRGIAAGFGYNSSVRVPAPADTPYFPLVAELAHGGEARPPLEVLDSLLDGTGGRAAWITPEPGRIWFALGIDFTVFRMVDAQALALVELGDDFTVAVLGLATASFPLGRGDGPVLARVQLALQALYTSRDGMLALAAELTPESFVLDPDCRLTGGLAYRTWFSGAHAGDFVFTLGGYHRDLDVPAHYPTVPRLGFTWGISDVVTIRGEAYCALTPAALMAGGRLEVAFHSGIVDAWLTARLDALIQWKPFWFRLGIGVRVGFSVDLWLFTVRGEVGVDLDLWGPRVGGIATVHLWCVDFDISFGASARRTPPPVSWTEFQEQLPARDEMLRITPLSGILPEDESVRARRAAAGDERWVVSADGFSFSTTTAVPASRATAGTREVDGEPLDIRPMDATGIDSAHTLTVTLDDRPFDPHAHGWVITEDTSAVPRALWGTGEPDAHDPLVPGRLLGLTVVVPPPQDGPTPGEMTDVSLGHEDLAPSDALPLTPADPPAGPVPERWQGSGPTPIGTIAATIAGSTVPARDALHEELTALGLAPPDHHDPLDGFAARAASTFTAEPLTI